jgi:hypothetical protein
MNNAQNNKTIYTRNRSKKTKLLINKCNYFKYLGVYISMDNRYKKHQQEVKKNYKIVGKLLTKKTHLLSFCQMTGLINLKIISMCRYGLVIINYF